MPRVQVDPEHPDPATIAAAAASLRAGELVAFPTETVYGLGAAALDLAYVAAGRLDGFWELKLKPWDVAAGVLLVREAGGTVTTFDGSPYDIHEHRIVASNGLIHDEVTETLTRLAQKAAR